MRPRPIGLLLLILCSGTAIAVAPRRHGDFAHYTFALTWQPGFCTTDGGCMRGQPRKVLIGLHGLWASRPRGLIERGISAPKWWHRGCDLYHHSDRAPHLSQATVRALRAVMPHLERSLLRHEYDKHVQCFGFGAEAFFKTELRLRKRIIYSAFARYLKRQAKGRRVKRSRVMKAFMNAFGTRARRAVQLRCGTDQQGRHVLTQFWITFHADALRTFPQSATLMNAPIPQANCPAVFYVPNWPPRRLQ